MSARLWLAINRTIGGVLHKQCCACKAWLPRDVKHFPKKREHFRGRCRPCEKSYALAYQKAHYDPEVRRVKWQRYVARKKAGAATMLAECWKVAA
jgi:hypothetical protein